MTRFLPHLALAMLLSGCIPLRQQTLIKGPPDATFNLGEDRYLEVFQIGDNDIPNHHKIIPQESFIRSPSGTRYSIQVKPHLFDIQQHFTYVRDDIFPYRPDGTRLRRWSNGLWEVYLVVDTDGDKAVIDQYWRFWTFYYNPIIHGAPN